MITIGMDYFDLQVFRGKQLRKVHGSFYIDDVALDEGLVALYKDDLEKSVDCFGDVFITGNAWAYYFQSPHHADGVYILFSGFLTDEETPDDMVRLLNDLKEMESVNEQPEEGFGGFLEIPPAGKLAFARITGEDLNTYINTPYFKPILRFCENKWFAIDEESFFQGKHVITEGPFTKEELDSLQGVKYYMADLPEDALAGLILDLYGNKTLS